MLRKSKSCLLAAALILCSALLFTSESASAATTPLTAGATYTITLDKMLSDGTTSTVSSTTAVADANGKIAFSFSGVPTCPSANFLIVTVKDSTGNVERESFSPAPPVGSTNSLGANGVSTKQAEAIVAAGKLIGSDDPMVMAFGLLFTRTDVLSSSDITNIATLGKEGIINGMENYMTSNGATAAEMTTFKNALVCNQPHKDLSNFTTLMKSAVDTTSATASTDDMGKAGGMVADIFVDAAAASNINLDLVLAAFNAAGDKVTTSGTPGNNAMLALTSSVQSSMMQSVKAFNTRLATVQVHKVYSDALTALGASGTMVTEFNTAVTTLSTAMSTIDTTYAKYFDDPVSNPMTSAVQTAMDNAYSNAFTSFQTNVASSATEISDMRTNVHNGLVAAYGSSNAPTVAQLATDNLGQYRNFSGSNVNWPIPQTVATNFVANNLTNGGGLTYTRTTLAVPSNMTWLNGTGKRQDFTTQPHMPAAFAALMGIQEDVRIAESTRYSIFDGGKNPTNTQQEAARLAFKSNLAAIVANIGGTTDGTTAITAAQKSALVQSIEQPSTD